MRIFARNVRAPIAVPIAGNFQWKMNSQCKAIEWRVLPQRARENFALQAAVMGCR
ncbi:hypothetical protein [Bradyrhizobium sp. CCBAU 53421]|uniref:hypothetical protein n=1 Tax=Bradyrhizobium sp. CCBAU 53421 TaxID=1325120 RepID=UPI00188DC506|nr:hypothetical protein [Bradyrhizobium sp. CCBAU 53421]